MLNKPLVIMSEENKSYSPEEQRALMARMFLGLRTDLGEVMQMLISTPVEGGYLISTAAVAAANTKLLRAMAAMEGLSKHVSNKENESASETVSAPTPTAVAPFLARKEPTAARAKDGAYIAQFVPDMSPPLTESHSVQDILAAERNRLNQSGEKILGEIQGMIVNKVETPSS